MTGSERNAIITGRRWENGAVLEFLTVGAEVRAFLSGSVNGGAPLSQLCGERNEVVILLLRLLQTIGSAVHIHHKRTKS